MRARCGWHHAASGALCGGILSLFSHAACAQEGTLPASPPSVVHEFPKILDITVVADERLVSTFQERVGSWFSDGTEVRLTVTSEVDERRLLDTNPTQVRAWIVPLSSERALLTLSSVTPPAPPRHLVREVRLQHGLDELGLERLASVTHSAFVALSEGVEGVAREQAELELSQAGVIASAAARPSEPAMPLAALPGVPPAPPPASVRAAPRVERATVAPVPPHTWLLVSGGYGVRLRGPEDTAQGPNLALGAQFGSAHTAIDLQLSAQYLFRTKFDAAPFEASVQTSALRGAAGIERQLARSFVGQALFGLGVDIARVSASAASSSADNVRLAPRANGSQWRGVAELTFGVLARGALIDWGLYAQAIFALEDVRYSARASTGETLLVRAWAVQPALGIQGRFRSAL